MSICDVTMWHSHEHVLLLETLASRDFCRSFSGKRHRQANRQRMNGKDAQNALPGMLLGKKVSPYFGVCFPLDLKFH